MQLPVVIVVLFYIFSSPLIAITSASSSIHTTHSNTQKIVSSNRRSPPSLVITSELDASLISKLSSSNSKSLHMIMSVRGGGVISNNNTSDGNDKKWSLRGLLLKNLLGIWGVMQVVSILSNAIKRLYPIAIQPIVQQDIATYQWAMYAVWSIYMIYNEGYKAFQLKFSPLGE